MSDAPKPAVSPEMREIARQFQNLRTEEEVLRIFAETRAMFPSGPPFKPDQWSPERREQFKRSWGITSDDELDETLRMAGLVTVCQGDLVEAARVARYPLNVAKAIVGTAAGMEANLRTVVPVLRERGYSWTQIGQALGVTKQSAWERFSGED